MGGERRSAPATRKVGRSEKKKGKWKNRKVNSVGRFSDARGLDLRNPRLLKYMGRSVLVSKYVVLRKGIHSCPRKTMGKCIKRVNKESVER